MSDTQHVKDGIHKMRMSKLSDEQREHYQRRMDKGHGKLVEVTVGYDYAEDGKTIVPVEDRIEEYYVGRMDAGQSGKLVAILAALAIDGKDVQQTFKRQDALVFLEILDERFTSALFSIILHERPNWIMDNFDFAGWALDVLDAFMEKNDFLALIKKVQKLASRWGLNADNAKALALGGTLPDFQAPGEQSENIS